jgi:hypothetical protein
MRCGVVGEHLVRVDVDDRADIGGEQARIAILSSAIAPLSMVMTLSAMSSCTNSTRAAEQRWPAEPNADAHRVLDQLFGQRRRIRDQRVLAAGFGDQRGDRGIARGQARLMVAAVSVEPVKHTPATRASQGQPSTDGGAVARHELQHGFRYAGLVQQLHRGVADQVGLLGGLGDHAVAGGERGDHLAHEDGQREVPRADADEHAAPVQVQGVGFAGRAGQGFRLEQLACHAARSSGRSRPASRTSAMASGWSCRLRARTAR